MTGRRILITGAAGFIGFHLARTLASDRANSVICVDNFARSDRDKYYKELLAQSNVMGVEADLTKSEHVANLPDGVDVIYHLAALNGTQNFYERPFEVSRCCTLPTFHLIEKYGARGGLERFIFASTSEAYASTVTRFGWEVPTAEDVPLSIDDVFNSRWSYGAAKLLGEVVTVNGGKQFGFPFSIIRYHNVYGPRMGDKHVVPDFLTRAKEGRFELFGWEDTRAFLYVADAVRGTILVGQTSACAGQIVNVGGGLEIKILELAQIMMDVSGFRGEIVRHPSPAGSVKRRAPKLEKLRTLTGFEEQWSLRDGLKRTAEFYLNGGPA